MNKGVGDKSQSLLFVTDPFYTLEVGWGGSEYYQTPDPHFTVTLKAALLPTSSVLHTVGFNGPVAGYFVNSEVIRIELTEPGFENLYQFIAASFVRDETGHARPLGKGLYGDSRFYRSRETYHLLNTSNAWTARALREAGCPVKPGILTVDQLMSQARKFGTTADRDADPFNTSALCPEPVDACICQ